MSQGNVQGRSIEVVCVKGSQAKQKEVCQKLWRNPRDLWNVYRKGEQVDMGDEL